MAMTKTEDEDATLVMRRWLADDSPESENAIAREAYHADRLRKATPYTGPTYSMHNSVCEDDAPTVRRIL